MAGAAVGAVVGLEALFAGPICGASMNPARSIAPAIVSGQVQHLWIYIAAPILGSFIAVISWYALQPTDAPPAAQST
jgi:aquaporin Z